ncbi:MAG: DUF1998 domain-containing protein, partial [Deltaproteobacteria bacterium]
HTTSYWFTPSPEMINSLMCSQSEIVSGLIGIAYALQHVASMFLMSDVNDIDVVIGDIDGEWFVRHGSSGKIASASADVSPVIVRENFEPTIFLFDNYPGGIGFSDLLFQKHHELIATVKKVITNCPCKHGCPSCIGPVLDYGATAKETALKIIEIIEVR